LSSAWPDGAISWNPWAPIASAPAGGADIGPLCRQGVVCLGQQSEQQRYFDYHHSARDTIEVVNPRELQLGAVAMAIMAYILAEEGIS
jgi:hypothetical protein